MIQDSQENKGLVWGLVDLILGPVLSAMDTSAAKSGIALVGRLESDKWKVGDVYAPASCSR